MPSRVRKGRPGPEVSVPRNRPAAGGGAFEIGAGLRAAGVIEAAERSFAAASQSNLLPEDKEIAAPARGDKNP